MKRAWRNLIRRLRRDGWRATARALWTALRPARFAVYCLDRPAAPVLPEPFALRRGLRALLALREANGLLPDQFYYEGREGHRDCFLLCQDGEPVGVLWVISGRNASRYFVLGEQAVEIGGLYVRPQFRGRGAGKQLFWRSSQALLESGIREIYAAIESDNDASRRAAEAVGFRKVGQIRRACLWGPRYRTADGRLETWGHALIAPLARRRESGS